MTDWAELASNLPSGSHGGAEAPRAPLAPGTRVGRYEVLGLLGAGGMGQVYRARERLAGGPGASDRPVREVALKLMLEGSRRDVLRLLREGTVTAALRDPGIVQVHDQGEHLGKPYLVYELIEGARSLRDAAVGLDLRSRLRLVRDAARALGHAHAHGVVHRDVKPENLLVGSDGRVRVTDFGLAMGESLEVLTRTGELVGTPRFLAPEQAVGDRGRLGPPTDVWALGVIMFLLITGRHAFPHDTLAALCIAIAAGVRPRLRPGQDCDERLVAIVDRALQVDPARRQPDGAALAAELDAWLAAPPSWWTLRRRLVALVIGGLAAAVLAMGLATLRADRQPVPFRPPPWSATEPVQLQAPGDRAPIASDTAEPVGAPKLRRLHILEAGEPGRYALAFEAADRLAAYPAVGPPLRWDAHTGRPVDPPPRSRAEPVATIVPLDRGLAVGATSDALIFAGEEPAAGARTTWLAASHDRSRVVAWPETLDRGPREIRVYGASSGRLLRSMGLERPARTAALSPDGRLLAIAGGGSLELNEVDRDYEPFLLVREVEEDREVLRVPLPVSGRALAFSLDGSTLAIGTSTGQLLLWRKGSELLDSIVAEESRERRALLVPSAHEGSCRWVAFGGDGRLWSMGVGNAAVVNDRDELRVWDVSTGRSLLPALVWAAGEATAALSPDGALLALCKNDGRVEVWSTR